jgi:o-succinylbenzoate synthase
MKAHYINHPLHFKFPAGTSRGVLLHKPSFFIFLEKEGIVGIGECSTIPDLSIDPMEQYDQKLQEVCLHLNEGVDAKDIDLSAFPSIAFGVETALLDFNSGGNRILFENDFSAGKAGIPINGLVWMGDREFMQKQIREKIAAGYRCIKLKVGALDFETELEIISGIRQQFSPEDIEIRLDANGGFMPADALEKLKRLSEYSIHSIEQPIKPRQWEAMANICEHSPIPIVLDEELIGTEPNEEMLLQIKPACIILKPSLLGGFGVSEKWIQLAEKNNIGWWNTSALEANIGLNAIAQWTASLNSSMPQGLGTGQLYHNNIQSPLEIRNAKLRYNQNQQWDLNAILA